MISTDVITTPANGVTRLDYNAPTQYLDWDATANQQTMTAEQFLADPLSLASNFMLSLDRALVVQAKAAVYIPRGGVAKYPQSDYTLAFVDGYKPVRVLYADVLAKLKS